MRNEPWVVDAACKGQDMDVWFPSRGESPFEARMICYSCPVRVECLEYAVARPSLQGIWAGTSEDQRDDIRRTRRVFAS